MNGNIYRFTKVGEAALELWLRDDLKCPTPINGWKKRKIKQSDYDVWAGGKTIYGRVPMRIAAIMKRHGQLWNFEDFIPK